MKTIFLDGRFFKVNERFIDEHAPGVFKARGVFETMLTVDGFVLDAALHLKRLRKGLKILKIRAPVIDPSILEEVVRRNGLDCGRVRLVVWRKGGQTHLMAAATAYQAPGKKTYRVCLIKTDRAAHDRLSDVKSLDYGLFDGAYSSARARGFDEALLLNRRGYIFEASRANIFWTRGKVLFTTPLSSGCLNGITRQHVIRQAAAFKWPVQEMHLTPQMLQSAHAAFLTNSLIGIQPIEVRIRLQEA